MFQGHIGDFPRACEHLHFLVLAADTSGQSEAGEDQMCQRPWQTLLVEGMPLPFQGRAVLLAAEAGSRPRLWQSGPSHLPPDAEGLCWCKISEKLKQEVF